jgi:hypothetical protein
MGIPQDFPVAQSCFDLTGLDHNNCTSAEPRETATTTNRHTNWDDFKRLINERLTLNVSLKAEEDTEAAVKFFNGTIQWAGLESNSKT